MTDPEFVAPLGLRAWRTEQFQPGSPANVIAVACALPETADADLLRLSVQTACARYWAPPVVPDVVDLRHEPAARAREMQDRLLDEAAAQPFDLHRPPVRWRILPAAHRTVIALVAHRAALDEPSVSALMAEVAALYSGRPPGPACEAGPWDDHRTEPHLGFWREELRDLPRPALPTDWPRSTFLGPAGDAVDVHIPDDVKTFAEPDGQDGPGIGDVLTAAVAAVLVRLGEDGDVPISTAPISTAAGAAGVGAADVRAILRVDVSDDPDFGTLVDRVRRVGGAARRHALPLGLLASELGLEDDVRPDPFAAVAVEVRHRPLLPAAFGGLAAVPLAVGRRGVRHELRLVCEPDGDGGFRAALEYAEQLFERATAARIGALLTRLLATAAAEPRTRLSALPLSGNPAREPWNRTDASSRSDATLHELIAERARRAPDAPAVLSGERVLTYGELDARADRLAHALRAGGSGPGVLVGVCSQRSADTVIAVLATLKSGAAYVPLDPAHPAERLAFMLADTRVRMVLGDGASLRRLPPHDGTVLPLDEPGTAPGADPSPGPPPNTARATDPCYVIFTSGSTGRPKGAANDHRGVVNTMLSLIGRTGIGSTTRLLQVSALSFDMAAFDVFSTLLAGGCLVIPAPDEATDPRRLLALARREQITFWSSTPALFKGALDEVVAGGEDLPRHLEAVFLGGDRFPGGVPAEMAELAPWVRLYNTAGMTEASFTTTVRHVRPEDGRRANVPWGHPLANQRVYVLDGERRAVPAGAPGELYIGGSGVGPGYWNRADLTRERFLRDPFVDDPAARMYRTGDRVRHLADGALEFLGRLDEQVKVRGYRIEPGEIEAELTGHPAIADAVVGVRDEDAGGERLVAYCVFTGQGGPAVGELRRYLAERIPDYMVPAVYLGIAALPLTPNGKIDRRALAELPLPARRPNLGVPYREPTGDLERSIADEWSRILGIEAVGADDDFASLGGHSRLATAMMAALARAFGVRLAARDLYEASTPGRLAERIRQHRESTQ